MEPKYTSRKREIVFRVPETLWSACCERTKRLGFRTKTEAISHLAEDLWRQRNGLFVPKSAVDILAGIPDICQYHPWRSPKAKQVCFWMDPEGADKLSSLRTGSWSLLFNGIIEAFLAADDRTIRSFRYGVHAGYIYQSVDRPTIPVQVSLEQYDYIREMARNAGLKISQLLHLVLNVFSGKEESYRIPEEMTSLFRAIMQIEGLTSGSLKRDICVSMVTCDKESQDKIKALMRQYKIPGARELVRRLILFLLHSRELSASILPTPVIEDFKTKSVWEEAFDENESYWNGRMAKREFVSSLYR